MTSGGAKNIRFAACEPFFIGSAKLFVNVLKKMPSTAPIVSFDDAMMPITMPTSMDLYYAAEVMSICLLSLEGKT